MKPPRHIKSIVELGPYYDDNDNEYYEVEVTFKWWYVPFAILFRLLSRPYPQSKM